MKENSLPSRVVDGKSLGVSEDFWLHTKPYLDPDQLGSIFEENPLDEVINFYSEMKDYALYGYGRKIKVAKDLNEVIDSLSNVPGANTCIALVCLENDIKYFQIVMRNPRQVMNSHGSPEEARRLSQEAARMVLKMSIAYDGIDSATKIGFWDKMIVMGSKKFELEFNPRWGGVEVRSPELIDELDFLIFNEVVNLIQDDE